MISEIELKCFRKHKDLKLSLTKGLNALRGPNEKGKTTITEAIMYALFGAKVLRNPLADVVTWGHKESELKAKVVMVVQGGTYTFTRSKAGAECNYSLPEASGKTEHSPPMFGKVAGQSEVSAFASTLLGVDAKVASLLMMASQNELRGALDEGPAAVSALMGKLANFEMIDKIIETASQRLLLGSVQPLQDKLAAADVEVVEAQKELAGDYDVTPLQEVIDSKTLIVADQEKEQQETLQPAISDADHRVQAAKALKTAKEQAQSHVKVYEQRLVAENTSLAHAKADALKRPDAARITELRDKIADIAKGDRQRSAYAEFLKLPKHPEEHWEGTKEDFKEARAAAQLKFDSLSKEEAALNAEVRTLRAGKITSGKCPTCGHAATSDEHVNQHNDAIEEKVKVVLAGLPAIQTQLKEVREESETYARVDLAGRNFEAHAAKLHEWILVDTKLYPAKLSWRGPAPTESDDRKALEAELRGLEAQANLAAQAEGRATAHAAAVAQIETDLTAARVKEASIVVPDIAALEAAYDEAYRVYSEAVTHTSVIKQEIASAIQQRDSVLQRRQAAEQRLASAQARVVEYTADIKKVEFNNNLVAKLKKMKPQITDFLWNTVLSAVGTFFSSMRGEQSVVVKDASGFRINGKPKDSYSGSTQDVLALAMRVAMTKTFIPETTFMCLDEPAHGCDDTRTANVLGFLSSVGFQQVLLASHDELSEAVADNVILLGD